MIPGFEQFNEVVESLLEGGTRYHTEKIAVVSLFGLSVVATLVWVLSGIEFGLDLEGRFEIEGSGELVETAFLLENTGSTAWRKVRIVVNGRYLAKLERVPSGKQKRLEPEDFQDYFHVPRPWGEAVWERLGPSVRPGPRAPDHLEVREVAVRSREGSIPVERRGGS